MLLIYQDAFMMSMTNAIFQEITKDYEDIFDMYVCEDQNLLSDTIYFKDTHP